MWKVSLKVLIRAQLVILSLLLSVSLIGAAPDADEIKVLPGYGVPPTPQWSGFLDAGKGTKLHYWMAAAEADDWTTKPVVLWLNGGPGSSSLLGMLQEQGPLLFGREIDSNGDNSTSESPDGKDSKRFLFKNPYAWTKLANLVAVESPAGVGYSYCKESLDGKPCHNDDISTAKDLHAALQDMFATKFPELLHQDFFITGESYAGVYCPTLAKEILDANDDPATKTKINLVGMAVGDPCTDNDSQEKAFDMLWYGHKYGFVPDDEFHLLYNKCGARYTHVLGQSVWSVAEGGEKSFLKTPTVKFQSSSASRRLGSDSSTSSTKLDLVSDECKLANRKFLMQTSKAFSQEWKHGFINDLTLFGSFAIVGNNQKGSLNYRMTQWMISDEVQEALHVTESPATEWPGPSDGWTYASNYTACNENPTDSRSMIDFYQNIAPRIKGTVLIYNGDTDPCVTYEGTRTAIERVGFDQTPGGSYRPWFYNATADSCELLNEKDVLFGPALSLQAAGPQFAGHVTDYEHGLSFCTVHGSGHMVPQFRPRAALRMLAGVLTNTLLSPNLAADTEMLEMKESEYDDYLDQWVDKAKAWSDVTAPYN